MLVENGFIADVESWLKTNLVDVGEYDADGVDDEVHPDDSVSNVASKNSQCKSTSSSKHTHNSVKSTASSPIKADAEKAARFARAAALKEKHALEAQEEQLRRKREQLVMNAEIAASIAKLAVYKAASECSSKSRTPSDGLNSYLQRREAQKGLNPSAKSFQPCTVKAVSQGGLAGPEKDVSTRGALQHEDSQQPISLSTNNLQLASMEPYAHSGQVQGDLCTIMHRQNEITAALVQQQRLMSLPSRDIPVFDGDPLQYKNFRAFEHSVESKANQADCLHFLEQFTIGHPRELVRSCQHDSHRRLSQGQRASP